MDLKKTNIYTTIISFLLFASVLTNANNQESPLVKAIQLFDDGNFTEAEKLFKNLLDEKPDHLMVNYYYGACRTENGIYGTNEIIFLLNGSIGESPLKTDYYIAVQYHAKNRWGDALKHYTRYKSEANPEQQKEVLLLEKIQQCYEKVNPFVSEEKTVDVDVLPLAIPREKEIEEYNPIVAADTTDRDSADTIIIALVDTVTDDTILVIPEPAPEKPVQNSKPINFEVNNEITYLDSTHFQTKKGSKSYNEATNKQRELNTLTSEIDKLRKKYGSTNSYTERQILGEQILAGETDLYKLQNETTQLFAKAKREEINYWNSASADEKEDFVNELDEYVKANEEIVLPEIEFDTAAVIDPNILLVGTEPGPQADEQTKDDLIYKIQLGAFSRGIPSYIKKRFDKLSYIRKIENHTDEKGVVVYTTGNLTKHEDALKMQNQVRQEGIEDAFVVPYFNGKRITLNEAKEIEAGK